MRELERVIKKYDKITFICIGSDRVAKEVLSNAHLYNTRTI